MGDPGAPRGGRLVTRYLIVVTIVLAGAALVVLAATLLARVFGGDGDSAETSRPTATAPEPNPTVEIVDHATWLAADPLDAPDCDPETGRIMVPSLYAPNCVPLWPDGADNRGATHRGVTAEEIVVAVYVGQPSSVAQGPIDALGGGRLSEEEVTANRDAMVGAFGDLFETYGRTVRWEVLHASGPASDEPMARADALRAAEEIGAFAVLGGPTGTTVFAEELAERHVICFCTANQPIEQYERWAPYVWSGLMASTQGYVHLVDYVQARLIGGQAVHAGDPALHTRDRSFGYVWYETADNSYRSGTEYLLERLDDIGLDLRVNISYVYGTGDRLAEDASMIIARLKAEGVTTVIFGGDPIMPIYLTRQATEQGYYPEWVMSGFSFLDVRGFARQYDQAQWRNAFGLSLLLPPIDPGFVQEEGNLVSWHLGQELTSYPGIYDWGRLFTGIHLAGPALTPESFRDGLFSFLPVAGHRTEFGVSYGDGLWPWTDYLGADDVAEIWWDPDEVDPTVPGDDVRGMYRYTDGARRFLPGELDQLGGALFDPAGTIVYFQERPEGDRAPQYPPRSGRAG